MRILLRLIRKQRREIRALKKENRRLKSIYLEDVGNRDKKISALYRRIKSLNDEIVIWKEMLNNVQIKIWSL